MFTLSMVSRPVGSGVVTAALIGLSLTIGACQKVPLLAPTGSTITLTVASTALPVNGTTDVIAFVLESAGTPPQDGTLVIFTTTLGSIEPSEARTSGGRVVVKFRAGTANGTATISASSGGASASGANAAKVAIGTAAVGSVRVSANPTLLPAVGGVSTITGVVIDINGNPLSSAPVSFSTTTGSLEQVAVSTDSNGIATAVLRTSTAATVTVAVGAQAGSSAGTTPPATGAPAPTTPATTGTASGSVTVNVSGSPTLVITAPATGLTAGLPGAFTFAVTAATTNGSPIREVTVDWGDGQNQSLGAATGTVTASHVYRSAGSYVVIGRVTDTSGNPITTSTSVTVTAPALALAITPPATLSAGLPATFTVAPGVPAGDLVKNVRVDWGDNTPVQDLGAISASSSVSHVFEVAKSYTVTATLTDTAGNSITVSTFVNAIPVASPTINITPSVPVTHSATMTVSFQIQVTAPTGVTITEASINYGDGATDSLGGLNGSVTKTHPYTQPSGYSTVVTVTVKDSLGRTTQGTASITLP